MLSLLSGSSVSSYNCTVRQSQGVHHLQINTYITLLIRSAQAPRSKPRSWERARSTHQSRSIDDVLRLGLFGPYPLLYAILRTVIFGLCVVTRSRLVEAFYFLFMPSVSATRNASRTPEGLARTMSLSEAWT
jgi:hypothetical protein